MTWEDFIAAVKEEMPIEARRVGAEKLFDRSLRAAAADLQSFLPWLREGHGDATLPAAFTVDGMAARCPAPAGKITEVWLNHSTADEDRPGSTNRTLFHRRTWAWKDAMVAGLETAIGSWMLSPDLNDLWISPKLLEGQTVTILWSGIRDFPPALAASTTLGNAWSTPGVTLAASHFVRERFAKLVDHDLPAAQAHAADYARLRQRLYADFKERL